jgi:hypothetical protein
MEKLNGITRYIWQLPAGLDLWTALYPYNIDLSLLIVILTSFANCRV